MLEVIKHIEILHALYAKPKTMSVRNAKKVKPVKKDKSVQEKLTSLLVFGKPSEVLAPSKSNALVRTKPSPEKVVKKKELQT